MKQIFVTLVAVIAAAQLSYGQWNYSTGLAYTGNRVGIGFSSSPSLVSTENLAVPHSGANPAALVIGDYTSSSSLTGLYLRTSTEGRISVGTSSFMSFYTEGPTGTERMRLTNNGNLYLGASSTSFGAITGKALVVSDATLIPGIRIVGPTSGSLEISSNNTVGTIDSRGTAGILAFNTGSKEALRILANGDIGIGTPTPERVIGDPEDRVRNNCARYWDHRIRS